MVRRYSSAIVAAASAYIISCRVDHLRSVELCANALQIACTLLASPICSAHATGGTATAAAGTFVTKLWAGGEQQQLLADMRSRCGLFPPSQSFFYAEARFALYPTLLLSFATVKSCKPPASRPESVEMFFVCQGMKTGHIA